MIEDEDLYDDIDEQEELRYILEDIVRSLVSDPNSAEVTELNSSTTTILTIEVLNIDRGKIIGKGGIIINSIKNIFNAIGAKQNRSILIEIKED